MDLYLERVEDALGLDAVTDAIGEPTEPSFLAVTLVSGLVLGFVLVFRCNLAYSRFWEVPAGPLPPPQAAYVLRERTTFVCVHTV